MDGFMPRLNAAGDAWEAQPWELDKAPKIQIDSGNSANAAAVAALPAVALKFNYLDEVEVYAGGATTGSLKSFTVAGIAGGTQTFSINCPTGVTLAEKFTKKFDPPLKSSAVETAITVTLAALGTGNVTASVAARGRVL